MSKPHIQRIAVRYKTEKLLCDLFDGMATYVGTVENVSLYGLKIGQVPVDFDDLDQSGKVIIHSQSGDLTIHAKPRWTKQSTFGMYKEIGFQIDNPDRQWKNFIEYVSADANHREAVISAVPR